MSIHEMVSAQCLQEVLVNLNFIKNVLSRLRYFFKNHFSRQNLSSFSSAGQQSKPSYGSVNFLKIQSHPFRVQILEIIQKAVRKMDFDDSPKSTLSLAVPTHFLLKLCANFQKKSLKFSNDHFDLNIDFLGYFYPTKQDKFKMKYVQDSCWKICLLFIYFEKIFRNSI